MEVVVSNVNTVKHNLAIVHIVEPHQQVNERALSAPRFPNKGHLLVWVDCNVEALENKIFFPGWISEPNILKFNFASDLFDVINFFLLVVNVNLASVDGHWRIINFKYSFCRSSGFAHIRAESSGVTELLSSKHDAENGNEYLLWITPSFIYDYAPNVEHSSENKILAKVGDSERQPRLDMGSGRGLVHRSHKVLVFLDDLFIISERLNSLVVCHSITSKEVSFFGQISCCSSNSVLNFSCDQISDNHDRCNDDTG